MTGSDACPTSPGVRGGSFVHFIVVTITLIAILTVLASGVGTLTGFGTLTIMVPVLLLFFPLPQTLLLVGIIHWFGDIWKLALFWQGIRWKILLGFGVPGIVMSFLGASLTFSAPEELFSRVLGGFLIAYVVAISWRDRATPLRSVWERPPDRDYHRVRLRGGQFSFPPLVKGG